MSDMELVLGVHQLEANIVFFEERLGLTLDAIYPADAPRVAVLSGRGLRIRLDTTAPIGRTTLRVEPTSSQPSGSALIAPNGTRIDFAAGFAPDIPALTPESVITHLRPAAEASWATGRASMAYRDLLPSRLGGFVIASHIRIDSGGPVPDYVHFHELRAQLIYCLKGTARLVYEGQGEPFEFHAGDLVVQPPTIRHQVLETSDAFEVLEISCPAEHVTRTDPALTLPTPRLKPDALFDGQRFLHDRRERATFGPYAGAKSAPLQSWATDASTATGNILGVSVHRAEDSGDGTRQRFGPGQDLRMFFIAGGAASVTVGSEHTSRSGSEQAGLSGPERAAYGSFVAVSEEMVEFSDWTHDFEVVEIRLSETSS